MKAVSGAESARTVTVAKSGGNYGTDDVYTSPFKSVEEIFITNLADIMDKFAD